MKDDNKQHELTIRDLVPALKERGIIKSMSDMRRLIKQGAVSIITYGQRR